MKLGVDLDMFHLNNGGAGAGFAQGGGHHHVGGAGWHRDQQYAPEDEEEDDYDDDDFMFQGPGGGGGGGGTRGGFSDDDTHALDGNHSNFDAFSHRQDFAANGFDLNTGEVVAASFADFASFDDEFHRSASPESFSQPAAFDDFANFAAFEAPVEASVGATEADGAKAAVDDFAPSEF